MISLEARVTELNRVGKSLAAKLKKLGIETARDLIFYYPFRYDDFSQLVKIKDLQSEMMSTIRGRVELIANRRSPRKRKNLTEALIGDETGSVRAIWFNQPWIAKNLKVGDEVFISGRVTGDLFNVYFNSPSYEKTTGFNANTARLVPIYPLTEGISQKQLRFFMKSVITLAVRVEDFLPPEIISGEKLLTLPQALKEIHFPTSWEYLARAKKRLSFDELFLAQLWSQIIKQNISAQPAKKMKFFLPEIKKFISSLPFELTLDQKKAAWEILQDVAKGRPMNRLLEGDVGSGKTIVSVVAIYNVFLNSCQSVMMAPTEILAWQHYKTLSEFLRPTGMSMGIITRSQKYINEEKVSSREFWQRSQAGELDLVVGTHSLIQKEAKFACLSLVIIDEQHRFGVAQRKELKEKSAGKNKLMPHFLSLTATPIPRSLALTIYGDLELSIIRQLPRGRRPIITRIVPPEKRQLAYEFIAKQIAAGRQVFVVCPLIDPSDRLGVRSVTQEFKKLDEQIFPHLQVGLLHGRLKGEKKEKILKDFSKNKIKILVATSVVEVGIDIPNASVMMVEGAERFGLAQLHQFRGRVGRSQYQSFCFLFSDSNDKFILRRLQALVESQDGFALAQRDLELRGAGQVFGYQQSGWSDFKLADLKDLALVKGAKSAAEKIITIDGSLIKYPLLKNKVESLGFSDHLE